MDDVVKKNLRRFQKLRALGRSPNENEAKRALERAAALAKRYGFTEDDAEEAPPVDRRAGGTVKAKGDWREVVAYGVAARWGCRPLRGGDQVIFEGVKAVDAVAEYREIIREIDEAQERCWRAYDHKYRQTMQERHRKAFTAAAAKVTVEFAGTLGEDHHTTHLDFEDEGRREARTIMLDRVLKRGKST